MTATRPEKVSHPWRVLGVVVLAALLPQLPYLQAYFFMDDFWHLARLRQGNYIFTSWTVPREAIDALWYMSRQIWPSMAWVEKIEFYFRPLTLVLLDLDRQVFGFWAPGYHAHSILWHLANVLLLFTLLRRLGLGIFASGLAASAFGMHPLGAQPVGWVSSRCDLITTAFMLLGTLAYLNWRESGRLRDAVWHLLALLAALLSKEHAAALPFVLLAFELGVRWRTEGTRPPWSLRWLPGLLIAVGFVGWRIAQSGDAHTWSMPRENFNAFMNVGPLPALGYNLVEYARLSFLGFPARSFVADDPAAAWHVLVLFLALAVWACGAFRSLGKPGLLLWLYSAGLLGAMLWIPAGGRYLYPAAPGLAGLLALGVEHLQRQKRVWKRAGFTVLFLVLSWLCCMALLSAFMARESGRHIETVLNRITDEVRARPEATDLYLLHLWPMLVSSEALLPDLTERPDLKIHILTYRSSLYNPALAKWHERLTDIPGIYNPKWNQPLTITTEGLDVDKLSVKSEPVGFFSGPASFGWHSLSLPVKPGQEIKLAELGVRFGQVHGDGVRRLMFTLPRPLTDPKNLFLIWNQGRIEVWKP